MWIGICEDDAGYRAWLERKVRCAAQPCDRVTVYTNGSEMLDDIYSSAYPMDMLLLDIEMPGLTGIEAAQEMQNISPDTQIVIVTQYTDYALRSFVIHPSNYLIKPVADELLKMEIDRARRIVGETIGDTFHINAKDTVAFVPLKNILYIECIRYTLYIHTAATTYQYNRKISLVSDELAGKGFCRIHKSFLVNLRYVRSVDKSNKNVWLLSGIKLPVSGLRINDVLTDYSRSWQSMVPRNAAPAYTGAD